MIDMHAHWRPAELADALRIRAKEPRIVKNGDGIEVLKSRNGEEPLSGAFDEADTYLAMMDRLGVQTSALSLLGQYCWIESAPLETSVRLCRSVNDGLSTICQKHPGAEHIVCGTDGTEFGVEWTRKALAEAQIGDDAREKILHGNAAALLARRGVVAQRERTAA
jgi:hypothetical protein